MKKKLSTLLLIICMAFSFSVFTPSTNAKAAPYAYTTCFGIGYNTMEYNLYIEYGHWGGSQINTTYSLESTGNIYKTYIYPSSYYNVKAKVLQYALRELGYSLSVDGYYGPGTKTAVTQYQKSKNLSADGIAGPTTLNSIVWNLKVNGKLI